MLLECSCNVFLYVNFCSLACLLIPVVSQLGHFHFIGLVRTYFSYLFVYLTM